MEKGREPLSKLLQEPEEQTDNWDDDFEEEISLTKLHALDKPAVEEEKHEGDDNARTIRPLRSPVPSKLVLATGPSTEMTPIVEDYSDLAASEEEDVFQGKVADFKLKNGSRRGLFHPKDIQTLGIKPPSPGPRTAPILPPMNVGRPSGMPSISRSNSSSQPHSHARSSSFAGSIGRAKSIGRAEAIQVAQSQEFDKYAEEPDEDYDDLFGKTSGPGKLTACGS